MMVAATDSLATNNRTAELTPMARKDIDAHPDQVFVVEVYVPATDTGAEHILKREDFTVYGLGEDVYRSEEHTSELQSLMPTSYAVFCLNKKIAKKHTY